MVKRLRRYLAVAGVVSTGVLVTPAVASADATYDSPSSISATGAATLNWTGQGTTNGSLNTVQCTGDTAAPGSLLWIFTTDGGSVSGTPVLTVNGDTYASPTQDGGSWHFLTTWYAPNTTDTTASVAFDVADTGNGSWNLVISHGCPPAGPPPAAAPTITKIASGTFDQECSWGITKSVSPQSIIQTVGSPAATFNYTVTVTAPACNNINHVVVAGTITVNNPNTDNVTIDGVADQLSDGTVCAVVNGGSQSIAAGDTTFSYSCDLSAYNNTAGTPPPSNLTNTATVTWSHQTLTPSGDDLAAGSASFTTDPIVFTGKLTDDCATVSDTNGNGPQGVQVCVTDATAGATQTWTYSVTFSSPPIGSCQTFGNTASFADNSTPQNTGSAIQNVTVCNYNAPLTIGYWGNHLAKNGTTGCTGLPSGTGCSSNGPWTVSFLPQSLGTYSVVIIGNAAKVFAANNCSNASTSSQNAIACLAAQLLAAELNVANLSNPCIVTVADGINDANTFLSGGTVDGVTGIVYAGPTASYTLTTAQRNEALALKNKLVNYNQGGGC